MTLAPVSKGSTQTRRGAMLASDPWDTTDRYIRVGISHATGDPTRHRSFEIRATFDSAARGWIAYSGEQNLNDQRGVWQLVRCEAGQASVFPTAAACLGGAVSVIVAEVDRDAKDV